MKLVNGWYKTGIITKQETNVLKGIAILCIILHNLCHNIAGTIQENEFCFEISNSYAFAGVMPNGEHLFANFFSYFGHFTVGLFVFCTGYGLTISMQNTSQKGSGSGFCSFMLKRMKKMWALMISALLCYIMVSGSLCYVFHIIDYFPFRFQELFVLTFLHNLVYPVKTNFFFGPWWYWGVAFQLILLYRLCVYRRRLHWIVTITVLSLLLGIGLSDSDLPVTWLYYYKHNAVGWILPFALGVIMARKNILFTPAVSLFAAFLLALSCVNEYLWHFSQLFAVLVILGLLPFFKLEAFNRGFLKIGEMSMFIFASHTIVKRWVQPHINFDNLYVVMPIYLVMVWCMACLCKFVRDKFVSKAIKA